MTVLTAGKPFIVQIGREVDLGIVEEAARPLKKIANNV
jgi:hypothetical protein